jgi:hypothetical protein
VSTIVAVPTSKLLRDRALLRFRQRHVVAREEHVEVRLRHAQRQVLLRVREHRLRLQHLLLGLADRDPVLHAEDRLRQRHGVGLRRDVEIARDLALDLVAKDRHRAGDEGQVARARLRQLLARGRVLRARRLIHGIAHAGVAVDREKVGGRGRLRGGGQGERDSETQDHSADLRGAWGVDGLR